VEKRKSIKEKKLYLSLGKSTKLLRERLNALLETADSNISFDQWLIVDLIGMQAGINQKTIVKVLYKEPASVSRMVNKLISKKLIVRSINPLDKKAYQLFLSNNGKILFEKIKPEIDKEFKEIFTNIYERELNLVLNILDRLDNKD